MISTVVTTLYVHKAHHADIKNQHLVIGQLKNPANQKQPALFYFVLAALNKENFLEVFIPL